MTIISLWLDCNAPPFKHLSRKAVPDRQIPLASEDAYTLEVRMCGQIS